MKLARTFKGKIQLKAKKQMRTALPGMMKTSMEKTRLDPSGESKSENEDTSEEEKDDVKNQIKERKKARAQLKKLNH